ncbi:MAG: hypothetical protein KJP21_04055 [Bacteroidia bacterium]|nr:hypothetical protein [Bacteroidia bacterium]NNJ55746.1 hypothetical protein [Bacteroidia bacterium]
MDAIEKIIAFIEDPHTSDIEREKALTKLNISGIGDAELEEKAYAFWHGYFAQNIEDILSKRLVLISHMLPDVVLNQCFTDVFNEYVQRKKDLGIDDIKKFWGW